ncbi:MAG: HAD-IIA family hydrolase [Spirochaetota bacterium]
MESLSETLKRKTGFICDMDGVIYHGNRLLPGASEFVEWLKREGRKFLFLTNSSERSPRELQQKLARLGVEVAIEHFYTSALATAGFLASQAPGGTAYVIGEPGLINALYEVGYTMNDVNPDYVVFGESQSYGFERIEKAVNLILGGAKLVATNPDLTGPGEHGTVPGCGSLVAPIELATGHKPYFVGKPNPLMMRQAMRRLECRREETFIIGDRMDTDIIAGVEAEIDTILLLSGVTSREDLGAYAYQPRFVLDGAGDIPKAVG